MALIESPESNRHRFKILLLLSLDDDSVPKVQVNVPFVPAMFPPLAHPGSEDMGVPAPLYAVNISAQPFVPDKFVVQVELSGIHTQHPPYVPVTAILNSDTLDLINSIWKYCAPDLLPE